MSAQYEKRVKRLVWIEFRKALPAVMQTKIIVGSTIWCLLQFLLLNYTETYYPDNWIHEILIYTAGISMLVFFGIRGYSSLIAKDSLADLSFDKNIKKWQKKVIRMPKIDRLNLFHIYFLFLFKLSPGYYISTYMLMGFLGLLNSLARKETMKRMSFKFEKA